MLATLGGFLFLNTLYLQDVRGYSAVHTGLLTIPMPAALAVFSNLSGRLVAARGPRPALIAAGGLIGVAVAGAVIAADSGGFVQASRTAWAVLAGCGVAVVLLGTVSTGRWALATAQRTGKGFSSLDAE